MLAGTREVEGSLVEVEAALEELVKGWLVEVEAALQELLALAPLVDSVVLIEELPIGIFKRYYLLRTKQTAWQRGRYYSNTLEPAQLHVITCNVLIG